MRLIPFISIVIFCIISSSSLADVYRWKDDSGKIVFGDSPPKNKTATTVTIDETKNSGTQFATPGQVQNFKHDAAVRPRLNKTITPQRVDPHCRNYISQLNQVEIYLEHTVTKRDQQKSIDLRKLIKKECGKNVLSRKFDDSQCTRHRESLSKLEIYLEHTVTPRDQQKAKDLRQQIIRECQ